MIRKLIKWKKNGFTLVELLITLAILSLVLMMGFMIFGFGQKTFTGGTKQYDLQSNIRLSDNYIAKQLRYAPVVKIMDKATMNSMISTNGGILPYENFIYYDTTQKAIVHKNVFFTKTLSVGPGGNIIFNSTSTPSSPSSELYYKISGEDGSKNYFIENKINCLNAHLSSTQRITFDISPTGSLKDVIYFRSNDDFLAEKLKPLATLDPDPTLNGPDKFNMTFTKNIIGYTITTPTSVDASKVVFTNPSSSFGFRYLTPTSTPYDTVLFSLTFEDNLQYDYLAVYDSEHSIWSVK